MQKIDELIFENCIIEPAKFRQLIAGLIERKNVRKLSLSNNYFDDDTFELLLKYLS